MKFKIITISAIVLFVAGVGLSVRASHSTQYSQWCQSYEMFWLEHLRVVTSPDPPPDANSLEPWTDEGRAINELRQAFNSVEVPKPIRDDWNFIMEPNVWNTPGPFTTPEEAEDLNSISDVRSAEVRVFDWIIDNCDDIGPVLRESLRQDVEDIREELGD